MKSKILVVILALAMCFAFAGCSGNSTDTGETDSKVKEPEKPKVTSIIGSWECENIEVVDNGEKLDKDTVEMMFGEGVSNAFKLAAYDDGLAYVTMMEEEGAVLWSETSDKVYKFSQPGAESDTEDSGSMAAKLDGETLTVTVTETYLSDGVERSTEMIFTMKYLGKESRLIEGWDVTFDDHDVYAMSNFMVGGLCVEMDGMLYGDYGGDEWGEGAFTVAKIKEGKLEEPTVITENAKVSYLSIYDDDIYGILDNSRIIKLKDGKAKVQTLYEGTCYYMQVTKSGIYFTDEKNHYCKVDLDGKDKEIIIEKEVYYPYQVNAKFLVYQDDADGETLHVYNMENGNDTKISDVISYEPMLCGDYLYFYTPGSDEDLNYMCRVNMYSGKLEKAEQEALMFDYYVTPDNFSVAMGGFVTAEFDEWNKFADKNGAGFKFYPIYSNGEIWITWCDGENFMGPRTFGTDDEKSIGYSYVNKQPN